jgi:hypothetical protein
MECDGIFREIKIAGGMTYRNHTLDDQVTVNPWLRWAIFARWKGAFYLGFPLPAGLAGFSFRRRPAYLTLLEQKFIEIDLLDPR